MRENNERKREREGGKFNCMLNKCVQVYII